MTSCRVCGGPVVEFFDFGRQPVSDVFPAPADIGTEHFYRLAVGFCTDCTMVQQLEEVDREKMFPADYPYRSSGSSLMRRHFEETAAHYLATELDGPDPFYVEIGCNDGIMLNSVRAAGVRHLGVDPAEHAALAAGATGSRVHIGFFEEAAARRIREAEGPAQLVFSANTISHIAYIDSVFAGARALLAEGGVFVFEDRYLGDIVTHTYFDQVYDEHFYLFSVRSVQAMARQYGFDLIDVEHLSVHGGTMRYTTARAGERTVLPAVARWLAHEHDRKLSEQATYASFGAKVESHCTELRALLTRLKDEGKRVVGYGATCKSATVTNYCGIGPDLISAVCDSTPDKQHRVTPGSHIPILPPEHFSSPYPDYAVLFAWNHAEEIMAKEQEFKAAGGRWILYVPDVHLA
ncbi:class I SAM-dependent methyltransferase [Streptomyces californicus]|uniref:Class I SAM-dependent methyltransferase n=1 Tax=Streptomyces californicus TaxID=67351 RepID=A0ABD7CYC3_9ACTN|nr:MULTISPECIES: class I SAM-dependent methyltransferase [Streptomyces]QRV31016.1 class I SAM-dependent methyltransferase [Streptomyces californicus]QRV33376.1 class I SAM-dependent methyltransferase [Streptomyces californicus]QRV44431.1 class I SAM-dependent methyltransferase [Streptomyces californicus]QRV51120.1 class I SAM-dependent methyltransferase [Streptomyces californicus]